MKKSSMSLRSNNTFNQDSEPENGLQAKLAENMSGLFELVMSERTKHYNQNPDKIPNKQTAASIITSYSTMNAAVSGGITLIPGPFGMAAAIPEIVVVIRNQLAMICDLGMAYGKGKVLTKELLIGVLFSSMGTGGGTLLLMQGGKVVVKRAGLRAFQRVIALLAGKVTQRLLRSMVSKWLPVVGAVAMAAWSNYSTRQIGKKAIEIFEKDIEIESGISEEYPGVGTEPVAHSTPFGLDGLKIQALLNLMKVDGKIKPEEREFVKIFISKADLPEVEKASLLDQIKDPSTRFTIDYSLFTRIPEEAISLLVDLVALGKRDGEFNISEKMYIKQVGKLMGFSENDIEETMAIG